MFGDERASAKDINLFLMRLQRQDSAVSETTKLETHVHMCSHSTSDFCKPYHSSQTSNFSTIGQSVLEIRRWGVHGRTCRGIQLMTCIKRTNTGNLTTHLISAQCARRFPRYGKGVRTCARADATHPWLVEGTQLMTPTHIPNLNTIGEAVSEIQKRGVWGISARAHVQRYPTRDYCISCN